MVVGGVLCENCIVDASIFILVVSKQFHRDLVVIEVLCVFFKGTRWMPWHTEPMKDVRGCVMPRGVAN